LLIRDSGQHCLNIPLISPWVKGKMSELSVMRPVKEVVKRLCRIALARKAQSTISFLYTHADGVSKSLANVLRETLKNTATPEEKVWINKIELLRKILNSSPIKVSTVDYGAGISAIEPTDEEMYRGRIVYRTIGDVCRAASKSCFWAFLLFKLIREFRPSACLELGTALGISASFQAAALTLNQRGRLVTLEGAESLASLAQEHFQSLGLDNISVVTGRFQDTLGKVLDGYETGIDYAFIDGHHNEKATVAYFEQIIPFLSERAILVFDDISWSAGMKRAWRTIEADERVRVSINLRQIGICVIDRNIEGKQKYRIPLL